MDKLNPDVILEFMQSQMTPVGTIICFVIIGITLFYIIMSIIIARYYRGLINKIPTTYHGEEPINGGSTVDGIYKAFKGSIEKKIQNINTYVIISKNLSGYLKTLEALLMYFSGMVITLGLLGTFWGLSEAIGDIWKELEPGVGVVSDIEKLMAILGKPLGSMATAFVTSLFGLFASVIINVINSISFFSFSQARKNFFDHMEDFLDNRTISYNDIQTDAMIKSYTNKVTRSLSEMSNTIRISLEDMSTTIKISLGEMSSTITTSLDNMTSSITNEFKDGFDKLTKVNINLNDASSQLGKAIESLNESINQLLTTSNVFSKGVTDFGDYSKNFGQQTDKLVPELNEISSGFKNHTEKIIEASLMLKEMSEKSHNRIEGLDEIFNKFNDLSVTLNITYIELKTAISDCSDLISRFDDQKNRTESELLNIFREFKEQISKLSITVGTELAIGLNKETNDYFEQLNPLFVDNLNSINDVMRLTTEKFNAIEGTLVALQELIEEYGNTVLS